MVCYTHTYTHIHTHTHIHTYIYRVWGLYNIYIYIHTYIHTYIYGLLTRNVNSIVGYSSIVVGYR